MHIITEQRHLNYVLTLRYHYKSSLPEDQELNIFLCQLQDKWFLSMLNTGIKKEVACCRDIELQCI